MGNTAFVTGVSGFIGSHLVSRLLDEGWEVKVLAHNSPIHREEECEIFRGDIEDFLLLKEAMKGADVLFHLASALGGELIKKEEFYRINSAGTVTVFEAARAVGVKKVIHYSSAGVLGHVKEGDIADEAYPVFPLSPYDNSKLLGENTALEFAEKDMDVVVIRPGWVYGQGDRRTFKLVRAIAKKKFMLVTRGELCQTPVYIDDLIQGTMLCQQEGRSGEIYHLAGGEVLKIREIVQSIAEACGTKIPKIHLPLLPVKAAAVVLGGMYRIFRKEAPVTKGRLAFFIHPKPLAIGKAKEELGYSPQFSFKDGMTKAVDWYRHEGWIK